MNASQDRDRYGDVLAALDHDGRDIGSSDFAAAGERIAARLRARWGAPETTVVHIPAWTSYVRAASSRASGPEQTVVDHELGIEFTRTAFETNETRIVVTAAGNQVPDDIVRIKIGDGTRATELLVVLYQTPDGHLTGEIVTPAVAMSDALDISITPMSTVTTDHADAVTEAVRTSPTPGKNAWRRIAKSLPEDHPVRRAVLAGLR